MIWNNYKLSRMTKLVAINKDINSFLITGKDILEFELITHEGKPSRNVFLILI